MDEMFRKQSIIEDCCGVISLTATLANSAVVLLVWSNKVGDQCRIERSYHYMLM